MAKAVSDGFLDGGLNAIDGSTAINICTAQPTSIAECDSLSLIPAHTLAGGDFTIANGDTSGRKVTVAQQATLSIDASGTANHVAINNGVDFYVTTCTSQALTSGGTVTIPAWDIEFADPV
ncbi:MAG: hypothetical protein WBO93_08890 [Gammaproteobacteria bacterium]